MAHTLLGVNYKADDFARLRELDQELNAYPKALHERDEGFFKLMIEALVIGGMLMQQYGSSAPCSQSEHMIAHTYDLLYGESSSSVLHGEMISVTTMSTIRLQQKLIRRIPVFRVSEPSTDMFRRIFGAANHEALYQNYQKKQLSAEKCEQINDELPRLWPQIQAEIESKAMQALSLEKTLSKFGCITDHRQLRWQKERYENAVNHAYLTRDRFTFLDIPAMDRVLRAKI